MNIKLSNKINKRILKVLTQNKLYIIQWNLNAEMLWKKKSIFKVKNNHSATFRKIYGLK